MGMDTDGRIVDRDLEMILDEVAGDDDDDDDDADLAPVNDPAACRESALAAFRRDHAGSDVAADSFQGLARLPPVDGITGAETATCLAAHPHYVVVGTSAGKTVLVSLRPSSSSNRTLMNERTKVGKYGAVTAVDISPAATFVASGYQSGCVVIWDLQATSALKCMTGLHASPVTALRFSDLSRPTVLSVDGQGLVLDVSLQKYLIGWTVNHVVVRRPKALPGDEGPVNAVAVLRGQPDTPTLCALVCEAKVTVTKLTTSKPARVGSIALHPVGAQALVAWTVCQGRPLLCVAQGGAIRQFEVDPGGALVEKPVAMATGADAQFLAFVNSTMLIAVTNLEMVVFNVVAGALLQSIDISVLAQSGASLTFACAVNAYALVMDADGALYQVSLVKRMHRIQRLRRDGQWLAAMALAIDVHKDGDDTSPSSRSKLAQLAVDYLDAVPNDEFGRAGALENVFDFCAAIEDNETMFTTVYARQEMSPGTYFDALVNCVQRGVINDIPDRVIDSLIADARARNTLDAVEQALARLRPTTSVRRVLVKNCLWKALLAMASRAGWPISVPVGELLDAVPSGDAAESLAVRFLTEPTADSAVIHQRIAYLFADDARHLRRLMQPGKSTALITAFLGEALAHPRIWSLSVSPLTPRLPKRQSSFAIRSILGGNAGSRTSSAGSSPSPPALQRQRRVTAAEAVDVLLSMMVNSRDLERASSGLEIVTPLSPYCRADLSSLCRLGLSQGLISGAIVVPAAVLRTVISYVLDDAIDDHDAERMACSLIERFPPDAPTASLLLLSAISSRLRKLSIALHDLTGDVVGCVDTYLLDGATEDRIGVFEYLDRRLRDDPAAIQRHREAILSRIVSLAGVSGARTSALVGEFYASDHVAVIKELACVPEAQLDYLRGVLGGSSSADMLASVHELYIALLAEREPSNVLPYIRSHHQYSMDAVLGVCQRFQVVDATSFLLERTGDVDAALSLIVSTLEPLFARLRADIASAGMVAPQAVGGRRSFSALGQLAVLDEIYAVIDAATALCQRHADAPDNDRRWMSLLDKFLRMQKAEGRRREVIDDALVRCIQRVLSAMRGYVPLETILLRITSEHGDATYGEFRDTILALLETLAYEHNMLRLCNAMFVDDAHDASVRVCQDMARPIVTSLLPATSCSQCGSPLSGASALFYMCGHVAHEACAARNDSLAACHLCFRPTDTIAACKQQQQQRGRRRHSHHAAGSSIQLP